MNLNINLLPHTMRGVIEGESKIFIDFDKEIMLNFSYLGKPVDTGFFVTVTDSLMQSHRYKIIGGSLELSSKFMRPQRLFLSVVRHDGDTLLNKWECPPLKIVSLEDSEKQALQIQADYESVLSRSVDEINQRLEKIEAYIEKQKDISNII